MIGGLLYFVLNMWYIDFKTKRYYKRCRSDELSFIQQYKNSYKSSNKYSKVFEWKIEHDFRENYICKDWCRYCTYYVKISNDNEYTEYERGICKIRYKQKLSLDGSIVYNNWSCKHYHGY